MPSIFGSSKKKNNWSHFNNTRNTSSGREGGVNSTEVDTALSDALAAYNKAK